MRHRKKTIKLGRTSEHREAMLANLVSSLIKEKRVTTTLQKAKAARSVAEKMVTLAKAGTLNARRIATSRLHRRGPGAEITADKTTRARWHKDHDPIRVLFDEIAPAMKDRNGGYTRIYKLGRRASDSAERAILEWVNYVPPAPTPKEDDKGSAKKSKEKAGAATGSEAKKD